MEKILIAIFIIGVIVNFTSLLDFFDEDKNSKDTEEDCQNDKQTVTHKNSISNTIITYSLILMIIIFFMLLSFSGWFVIIKDFINNF